MMTDDEFNKRSDISINPPCIKGFSDYLKRCYNVWHFHLIND